MEPPAKRMRSLLSIEVDEENPEYINAKKKQQEKFKGRLESIFEKYGNMNDSMSDEIDMKTNTLAVDRGHLRRLGRKVHRKEEMMLLDTLGLAAGNEPEDESEEEENSEDLEDELAPTQQPAKSSDRRKKQVEEGQQAHSAVIGAQPQPSDNHRPNLQEPHTPAAPIAQVNVQETSGPPNPAANLLQLVSFPQTPAGQQAQTAFYTTLTHTINRAIQQAVVPLYNGLGLLPPNVQLPFATAQPAPTTPVMTDDKIAPATDPKWFFPPLSAAPQKHAVAQSSPLPTHTASPRLGDATAQATGNATSEQVQAITTEPTVCFEAPQNSDTPSIPTDVQLDESSPSKPRRSSPRVEIQVRRPRNYKKYNFTAEDDVYICTQARIHKRSWPEIKASKKKWENWPVSAIYNRWYLMKNKNTHIEEVSVVRSGDETQLRASSPIEQVPTSPSRSHHLPTPSSLESEDSHNREGGSTQEGGIDNPLSSSTHFDDDERELLSLAGADPDEDQLPVSTEEDSFCPEPEDVILPSIEAIDYMDEDNIQESLLEDLPMRDVTITPVRPAVKPEPTFSSPTSNRKRHPLPLNFQVEPEDDDEIPVHHQPRNSIDLVGNEDDDLLTQIPTTPHIKRETSTPPSTFLSAIRTPNTRLELNHSSGAKSSSKVDRKTFLKQVKRSWAKGATPAPRNRKSFHTLPRKRAWDEGSEDELAI